ncbi:MAG TPA: hypothetical protein DDX39_06905 [Bacteroidales bacterium]|nr:MAG: hypothetical protein A2W98_15000 [Bacteroidetes bacterium GWF2_33_38]OFY72931.1 MAG: hypothetical protein A2265_07785 [Bacteroidetes bacterium RIFOXYA12_FULL_33_9]OFY91437.1 MAG: hypothetical protein A2236_03370 [Bacteroidetes bacterium RIFOXYA2_FULL_33_7]HBF88357.1 hypothetical protein [Bacteroidales bacterium]
MKRTFLLIGIFAIFSALSFGQTQTYVKIILDTKLMSSLDYSLGGGSGVPVTGKVYAHLGLCTCNLSGTGNTATRDCADSTANEDYCFDQILPYKSNVWQHVVGNWGDTPEDDGVGLMTEEGNGVYSIEFIIENYFSSNLVSVESEAVDVVPSQPWDYEEGGKPYTIGMVFRNEDGTATGRDDLGSDLFIINLLTNPTVIQGSNPSQGFSAITFVVNGVEEVKSNKSYSVYPNPFSNFTTINYYMPKASDNMSMKVYNVVGEEIDILYQGIKEKGNHQIIWKGLSKSGVKLPAGIYYYVLNDGNQIITTQKIIISR